jgi:hypothetical protein
MNDKKAINDTAKKQQYNNSYCLKDSDFYPPSDNRVWKSNVSNIAGGDNFADFCEEFFGLLDEENYYEN